MFRVVIPTNHESNRSGHLSSGKRKTQKLHDPKEFSFYFDKNNHTTHKVNIQMNMHLKTPHCFPLTMKDNTRTISTI